MSRERVETKPKRKAETTAKGSEASEEQPTVSHEACFGTDDGDGCPPSRLEDRPPTRTDEHV